MATFKIDVTPDDIRDGEAGKCELCPIAIAAQRSLGKPVRVGKNWIFAHDSIGRMPRKAEEFVSDFDGQSIRAPVRPFSFYVTMVPKPPIKLRMPHL